MYDNFMKTVTKLLIIIYARLSKEEQGKSEEEKSQSIQNQIEICQEYIEDEMKEYPECEYEVVAIKYDDGVTGTTFDRNAFNEVIEMLENGKANMIITKDLSRFGREHINADTYIEKWLPEHNIRYVAILDGVDTYMPDNLNNDMTPIKNWMNEMYAKNTSRNVKKTFKKNMKKGIWCGGEPPLGYQVDMNNKGKLIIEPKGQEIVERIFNLAKENYSLDKIANILIDEKVPIPTLVKGNKRNLNTEIIELWSTDTIRDILQNEMYTGVMVQGKTTKLSFKSKKIIYLPKEDWIRVPNKVPVIIDKKSFDSVQLLIKSNNNKTMKSYDYLLKGMIRCKECGHAISIQHYKERKSNYTVCNYYRKYGSKKEVCTSHRFNYEELEKLVISNIKKECMDIVDSTNFEEKLKNNVESKKLETDLKIKIEKTNREISKLKKQLDKMYNNLLEGIIDKEQYLRIKEDKNQLIESENVKLERFTTDLEAIQRKNIREPNYTKIVKEFLSLKKPNKILITKLVDKILLSEDGTIDIYYKVKNPYKDK